MSIENEVVELVQVATLDAIKSGLKNYLQTNLFRWGGPFTPLINDAVSKMESVDAVIQEPGFKDELKTALRKRLVNELVKSYSLEGAFKELRNNPETKQRLLSVLESALGEP